MLPVSDNLDALSSPDKQISYQIVHILVSRHWKSFITDSHSFCDVETGNLHGLDHIIVRDFQDFQWLGIERNCPIVRKGCQRRNDRRFWL